MRSHARAARSIPAAAPAVVSLAILLSPFAFVPRATGDPICAELVGSFAKEVVSADFNEDGLADFAVTIEPNAVAIVLGQAGSAPTRLLGSNPTGAAVNGIAAGDMNGDGHADLVVAQPTGNDVRVLLGRGDGTFSYSDPIDAGSSPYRPVLGDLDGDGDLDVALLSGVIATTPDELTILLNNGDGSFAPRLAFALDSYPSFQDDIACGDIDGDGDADVVVLRNGSVSGAIVKTFVLARSNGDGSFTISAPITDDVATSAIALGDIDHDGRADLVARDGFMSLGGTTPPRRLSTHFGRADGTFDPPVRAPLTNPFLAGRLRLADMNHDGDLDAVMTAGPGFAFISGCGASSSGVALGDGAGGFLEMPPVESGGFQTAALAVGDANADGNLDVAATNYSCGTLVLNPGNGDGTLRVLTYTSSRGYAFTGKNKEVIRLNANKSNWCLSFESADGTFDAATQVTSVTLFSSGTGSVDRISTDPSKPIVGGDVNNDGIPDITVCFSKDALRQLFSNLSGRQLVAIDVLGELAGLDCPAGATLLVDVVPGGNNAAALLRRDASGGAWTLSYRADQAGPAHLRLFDVNGRLVRSLSARATSTGWNNIPFDGRDQAGRKLPSGVFFYRLDQGREPLTGKFVIAR